MDCKNFETYGSAYIDNMLSEEEKVDFKNHIGKCAACNIAFKNLKTVVESTGMLEEIELPTNFSDELHEKLKGDKNYKLKSNLFSKGKILGSVAATLLVLVISLSLVNNFLNHKKGTDFYFETGDTLQEESIDMGDASDEIDDKASDKTNNNEPVMALKSAPADGDGIAGDKTEENILEEMQGYADKNDKGEDMGSVGEPNGNKKSIMNENAQDPPDGRNLNNIFNPIIVLILTASVVILIYKIFRR